jgi:hypothetical protein
VRERIPAGRLQGLVLAGGYGRGQGGVLKTSEGDQPYNDLEFYVFLRGNRWVNDYRYRSSLCALGEDLSHGAGLHVEFKVDSLARLRRSPVSMFSYDLVSRHRRVWGAENLFHGCEHHLAADRIPLEEATRLLMNRCTGLLLARERLADPFWTPESADFVGRNLAKAQLALGDAVLTACRRYHWDCLERQRRLEQLELPEPPPGFESVRAHHAAGVRFKLHPVQRTGPAQQFREEYQAINELAADLWVWVENLRLGTGYQSPTEYALRSRERFPTGLEWRNRLLNWRTFGLGGLLDASARLYPRCRLFQALPILLWHGKLAKEPAAIQVVQAELHTRATDWQDLTAAYKRVWEQYG